MHNTSNLSMTTRNKVKMADFATLKSINRTSLQNVSK